MHLSNGQILEEEQQQNQTINHEKLEYQRSGSISERHFIKRLSLSHRCRPCPFIQISSRVYPDFIQISSRFHPDFIQILFRFYTSFIHFLFIPHTFQKLTLSRFWSFSVGRFDYRSLKITLPVKNTIVLIGRKFIKKNSLQDLLSSLNAVLSTNERH